MMKTASAKEINAPISLKHSRVVLKRIKGRKVDRMKAFLENLVSQKVNIDGKHYDKTARKVLEILKSAEANAKNKDMNVAKLFIKNARADKAEKLVTPRSRIRMRGRESKRANIQIVLEER